MAPAGTTNAPRLIRTRYRGVCTDCQVGLPAQANAWWDPVGRCLRCTTCGTNGATAPVSAGAAGRSASEVYERRAGQHLAEQAEMVVDDAQWRAEVKRDHPILGRIRTAVTPVPSVSAPPQHVQAWGVGADGERQVGAGLDSWAACTGNRVLHDRRLPASRANIDHVAVTATGVWVIDAKHYTGLVEAVGGGLRRDPELRVAGRRRTHLADGVITQMNAVAKILDTTTSPRPPVRGVLCFVGADWPLLRHTFVVRGVVVAWLEATVRLITRSAGPAPSADIDRLTALLASRLPSA